MRFEFKGILHSFYVHIFRFYNHITYDVQTISDTQKKRKKYKHTASCAAGVQMLISISLTTWRTTDQRSSSDFVWSLVTSLYNVATSIYTTSSPPLSGLSLIHWHTQTKQLQYKLADLIRSWRTCTNALQQCWLRKMPTLQTGIKNVPKSTVLGPSHPNPEGQVLIYQHAKTLTNVGAVSNATALLPCQEHTHTRYLCWIRNMFLQPALGEWWVKHYL